MRRNEMGADTQAANRNSSSRSAPTGWAVARFQARLIIPNQLIRRKEQNYPAEVPGLLVLRASRLASLVSSAVPCNGTSSPVRSLWLAKASVVWRCRG